MKLNSGAHPRLYKLGMKLHEINPRLWDYGIKAITLPNGISSGLKLKFGDKGKAGKITNVNIELTIRCNLHCKMCWFWGENGSGYELARTKAPMISQELTTKEIFNLVDQLIPHNPAFYLSGGEPFIREDTIDIIEYISNKGMSVVLNDNGTVLSDNNLKRLAKIKNLTINFSIDGLKKVHDDIRGQGVFNKATSTMKRLIELRGNSIYPAIKTNTTLSLLILGHISDMIKYLQDEVGVDAVRMQHLWFTDEAHAEAHKKVINNLFGTNEAGAYAHIMPAQTDSYAEKLADELMQVEKTKYKKPVFIHPQLNKQQILKYYGNLSWSKADRCLVAWNSIIVRANGDVLFCPDGWLDSFKLGNVRDTSIDKMWNGELAQKFRKELYKHKLFPACSRCCIING